MRASLIWALLAASACSKAGEPMEKPCGGPTDCTNPAEPYCIDGVCHACMGPSDCTADAPRCSADEGYVCGGCVGDLDCTAYPSMPKCAGESGTCVGCVDASHCANPFPACDPDERQCRGCIADAECDSQICDRATGACVDESQALYAAAAATDNDPCTKSQPCTLAKALAEAGAAKPIVKLGPGNYSRTTPLVLAGKTITIFAYDARFSGSANEIVSIRDGANISLRGLGISATSIGIEVTTSAPGQVPPVVDLEQMTFDGLSPYHLYALHGAVTVNRSKFTSTAVGTPLVIAARADASRLADVTIRRSWFEGGWALLAYQGGKLHVANSVWKNVADGAIRPQDGGTGDVTFSTFVDSPIDCGTDPQSQPRMTLSNNIVVASGIANVVAGNACTHRYSILYPQTVDPGSNNLRVDPQFVSATDFHLSPTSPAIDAAEPGATISEDHDGTARPQGAGRDIGAFERK